MVDVVYHFRHTNPNAMSFFSYILKPCHQNVTKIVTKYTLIWLFFGYSWFYFTDAYITKNPYLKGFGVGSHGWIRTNDFHLVEVTL